MPENNKKDIVWPSDEAMEAAYEAYALALGKVAHSWNALHEIFGKIFIIVTGTHERPIASAAWHVHMSDKAQRDMLRAAARAATPERWAATPLFLPEIIWAVDKADTLANQRNAALHAPATIYINGELGTWRNGTAVLGWKQESLPTQRQESFK